jgi:glutamyl-tRNA synthetase
MVNYLALLGWGDGTENEFFTLEQLGQWFHHISFYETVLHVVFFGVFRNSILLELQLTVEKFSIGRVNKSGAVFDSTKLR